MDKVVVQKNSKPETDPNIVQTHRWVVAFHSLGVQRVRCLALHCPTG